MNRIVIHISSALLLINIVCSFTYDVQATSYKQEEEHTSKYQIIEYGDEKQFLSILKKHVGNKVSVVSHPIKLKTENNKETYQIDGYTMEVVKENIKMLGKQQVLLTVYYQNLKWINKYLNLNIVDTVAPEIQLTQKEVNIQQEDVFDANSYIASIKDHYDEDLEVDVITNMEKQGEKYKTGTYQVTYRVSDSSSNVSEAVLQVHVFAKQTPVLQLYNNHVMINDALSLLGKPYIWGGKGPDAFDCSGIIMYLYSLQGQYLPWSSIAYGLGETISLNVNEWEIGDVLSYRDSDQNIVHHALYLGNHQVLHAMVDGVCIVDVDETLYATDLKPMTLVRVNRFI